RFFQSSYQNVANARSVTLSVARPGAAPEQVTLRKRETATLSDGTRLMFVDFTGNESQGFEATDWSAPVARLQVLPAGASAAAQVAAKPEGAPAGDDLASATALGGTTISLV